MSVIPGDVWQAISDLLHAPELARVCRRLRTLLLHRHIVCSAPHVESRLLLLAALPAHAAETRTFTVVGLLGVASEVATCAAVHMPQLTSLTLNMYGGGPAEHLKCLAGAVCNAPALTLLQVDLSCCVVEAEALTFLATIARAPRLKRLAVVLSFAKVDPRSANSLAELKESRALEALSLELCNADLHDAYAEHLAQLAGLTNLKTLTLNLAGNHISSEGARCLAKLARAPSLTALDLSLAHNPIHSEGAQAFVDMRLGPAMERLALNFRFCGLGPCGTEALNAFHPKGLRHFSLRL